MLKSLRSRLILASVLWTGGLLVLMHIASIHLAHSLPMPRGSRIIWPAIAGVAVMLTGLWMARGSLAHLRTLRGKVVAVQKGDQPRIDGQYPAEVQPLIDSLNELIAHREKAIQRAYATAGDLAHGLKTPLALLTREADTALAAGQGQLAESITEQTRRMASQVDYHLARARAAASGPGGASQCELAPCVAALVRTLSKLHAERALEMETSVPAGLCVRVRREDLEEILGNLLDNACKWSQSRIVITGIAEGSQALVTVEDDGPGLPDALRAAVLERGVRLDEAAPGSGLGLSIVRDLTELYGGRLALEESGAGGLRAVLTLPRA